MTEKYLWAGGAAVAGIVLGLAMSGGSEPEALVSRQMEEMQAQLTAAVADVAGKVDALSEGVAANETAIAALTGTLEGQAASLESLGAGTGENASALEALRSALGGLSGDQSRLSETVTGMTGNMDRMRGDLMEAMKDTLAAAAAAVGSAPKTAAAPAPKAAPAAEPAAEPATKTAPKTVATPAAAPKVDESAQAEALAGQVGDDGLILSVGQTATVGDTQVFLSRLGPDGAHLRVRGMDPMVADIHGGGVDVGNCVLSLAGIAAGKAFMTADCAEAVAAPAAEDLPGGTDMALSVGQTGLFGDLRVFLSRLDAGTAHLRIFTLTGMHENAAVSSRQPHVMGNGCGIALAGIDGGTVRLHAACGDAAAGLSDMATEVAAPAPVAEPEPEVDAGPSLAETLSETGLALSVGEAANVGGARLFVQRLPDNTAQIMQMGQGAFTLDVYRAVDLGNGCSVSLLGVEDGVAYLEPVCAE